MAKIVLVTGAAQRLGASIAQTLAHNGWHVALHYRGSKDKAQAVKDTISGATHSHHQRNPRPAHGARE